MNEQSSLLLKDFETVADLRTFCERAATVDRSGAIRLRAQGTAVLAMVRMHEHPWVLGMRGFLLGAPSVDDVVVELSAVLDRLARMRTAIGNDALRLSIPPAEVCVAWAGAFPPRSGWEHVDQVRAGDLLGRARAGETGAAAAAATLGFLSGDPDEEIPVVQHGPWTRWAMTRGDILIREPLLG